METKSRYEVISELHRCFHMINKYSSEKLSPEEFMEMVYNGFTNSK